MADKGNCVCCGRKDCYKGLMVIVASGKRETWHPDCWGKEADKRQAVKDELAGRMKKAVGK